jgi:hypothetical protein
MGPPLQRSKQNSLAISMLDRFRLHCHYTAAPSRHDVARRHFMSFTGEFHDDLPRMATVSRRAHYYMPDVTLKLAYQPPADFCTPTSHAALAAHSAHASKSLSYCFGAEGRRRQSNRRKTHRTGRIRRRASYECHEIVALHELLMSSPLSHLMTRFMRLERLPIVY